MRKIYICIVNAKKDIAFMAKSIAVLTGDIIKYLIRDLGGKLEKPEDREIK